MQLSRLQDNETHNAGYRVIAAIEMKQRTNGQPTHAVAAWNESRDAYATWILYWYRAKDTETQTNWAMCGDQGHYFHYIDDEGNSPRTQAIRDMMVRAGYMPAPIAYPDDVPTGIRVGTYRLTEVTNPIIVVDAQVREDGYIYLDETDITRESTDSTNDHRVVLSAREQANLLKVLQGKANPDILHMDGTTTPIWPHCTHCASHDTTWEGSETLTPDNSGHTQPCAQCEPEAYQTYMEQRKADIGPRPGDELRK